METENILISQEWPDGDLSERETLNPVGPDSGKNLDLARTPGPGLLEPQMVQAILNDPTQQTLDITGYYGMLGHQYEDLWQIDPALANEFENRTNESAFVTSIYDYDFLPQQTSLGQMKSESDLDEPDLKHIPQSSQSQLASEESMGNSADDKGKPKLSYVQRYRRRMDLPMLIKQSLIDSRPDSGSEENAMLLELANSLELTVDEDPKHQKEFRIGNGKAIRARGLTMINCAFAKEPSVELRCTFFVFENLICPLIMGMAFLEDTETLAKYRHRLELREIPRIDPFQLCSLDYPRRRLYCLANSHPKFANADTGSEIDLMSLCYVRQRGFSIQQVELLDSIIQFADGSIAQLLGKVEVRITLNAWEDDGETHDFYVLEGLTCDILLGEDFVNRTKAFESYGDSFEIDEEDDGIRELNPIVWFSVLESKLSRPFLEGNHPTDENTEDGLMKKLQKRLKSIFRNSRETPTHEQQEARDLTDNGDDDQRENHRREAARRTIAQLPPSEKEAASRLEQAQIDAYENAKKLRAQPSNLQTTSQQSGAFQCQYPGCTAPAFQTQYLLSSHAKIHGNKRPYYCPVTGCSRAKGGRGFKRKNEMIRHGLVHDSPGYICPFCPDIEHRYPRPDNLERHVRVNHVEVKGNDPRLQQVLSQRLDSTRRRKRVTYSTTPSFFADQNGGIHRELSPHPVTNQRDSASTSN